MATRYWVGGTGNWNDTAHWSTVTGPAGDPPQSVPIAGDDVYFDANSGAGACTINVAAACATITINLSTFTLLHNAGSTLTGAMTLTSGTLNTNGQTCSWGSFSAVNINAKTVTFGNSAIAVSGDWNISFTGTVVTTNTATLTTTGGNFTGGAINWNGLSVVMSGAGQQNIGAACTLLNLTRSGTSALNDMLVLSVNVVVTGTLTLSGNAPNRRLYVASNTLGTARTLTVTGATVTATNVTFCDLTLSGAPASATWTRVGDAGGNTGITANAAKTVYWVGGAGNWSDSTNHWASATSPALPDVNMFPLPQDTARIDANSPPGTITQDCPRLGSVDFTGSVARQWTINTAFTLYGSVNLTSVGALTLSGTGAITHSGRGGAYTITSAGKTWANGFTCAAIGSTITLADNYTNSSGLVLTHGTLDLGGKIATIRDLNCNATTTRSLVLTNSTLILSGTGNVLYTTGTMTVSATGSTISITDVGAVTKTFVGSGFTFGNLAITGGVGAGSVILTGNNTFNTVTIGAPKTITLTAGSTMTVNKLVAVGTAPNPIVLNSTGAFATISCANAHGIVCDYLNISNNHGVGGAVFNAGANSTLTVDYTGWFQTTSVYGKWWGQQAITVGPNPNSDINAILGALNIDVTQAPIIAQNQCSVAHTATLPFAYTAQEWFGSGAPGAIGANGDAYNRSDGGVGTSIYKKIAGAWTAIA